MTPWTLVLNAIAHHTCDRILCTLYLDDRIWPRLEEFYPHTAALPKKQNDTIRILWDVNSQELDDSSFLDPFGVKWIRSEASYQFVHPPLSRPDIKQIPRIRLLREEDVEEIRAIRRDSHDKFIYYQFTMTLGERLWALRGLEQYLIDLVEHPRFVHEVRHMFGAYELKRDTLVGRFVEKKNWMTFLEFLKWLRRQYRSSEVLHIIPDNAGHHLKAEVLRYAAAHRIKFYFTPTGVSWLNRIESYFTAMKKFALDNTDYRNHEELQAGIERYLSWRNGTRDINVCSWQSHRHHQGKVA